MLNENEKKLLSMMATAYRREHPDSAVEADALVEKIRSARTTSEAGRIGGLGASEAKLAAIRENGKKGGRPRKQIGT